MVRWDLLFQKKITVENIICDVLFDLTWSGESVKVRMLKTPRSTSDEDNKPDADRGTKLIDKFVDINDRQVFLNLLDYGIEQSKETKKTHYTLKTIQSYAEKHSNMFPDSLCDDDF